MQIICDKCKAEIHPQPETLRDGEIEHTFFRCPECGVPGVRNGRGAPKGHRGV